MARPKNDPTAPAKATTPEEAIEKGDISVDDIPADQPFDQTLAQKIEFAKEVLDEKAIVNERLQAVRELCTLLTATGSGDREQVAWVRFHLPRKTRKNSAGEDEVEAVE